MLPSHIFWKADRRALGEENTLNWQNPQPPEGVVEPIRDYVAELQLHMTLQARNLLPSLNQARDSREQLLQETQAIVEKLASRQALGNS